VAFGLRRAKVLGCVRAISFQDFQPIYGPDPPTLQTDGQTDGQTDDMRSQYRALHCTKVHRAVKTSRRPRNRKL